ncbi:MAG TPA: PAS domain S-box protein, partial [Blastocatellia bacterium]|nr:PAS domain S-box protein [Blastocatellia bacterium]
KILLADDNVDMRQYVRRLLGGSYEVVAVADGEAALEAVRKQTFDLVLSDVMMPRLDGFELLREIRADERTREISVILLSARAGEEAKVAGLEAGANDYLTKPFSAKELLARVEARLQLQRARRESQAALRESERKFSAAFERSPLALAITSLDDGRLVEANESFLSLTGYTREEAMGSTLDELKLWVGPEQSADGLARLRAGEHIDGFEARFRTKSGEERIGILGSSLIEINSRPHELSSVSDITERERAAETLRRSEAQLRLIADTTPALISYVDTERRYRFANGAYLRWFDCVPEEIIGRRIVDVLGEAAYEAIRAEVDAALSGQEIAFDRLAPYKAGGMRYVSVNYVPDTDERGEVKGFFALINDITERKRTEMNLAFLAEISQDLTRLTSIDEMMRIVGAKIGAYLDLSLCAFVEINEAVSEAVITHVWHREDTPSIVGVYRVGDFFTDEFQQASRAGEIYVVRDTVDDPRANAERFATFKIRSFVTVPLIRGGQFRFLLGACHSTAYDWRGDEIELIRELTTRIWTRLERAHAEEALRESEGRFRNMADHAPVMVWVTEADATCSYLSQSWYEFTGQTPDTGSGFGWLNATHPDDRESAEQAYLAASEKREAVRLEYRLRRKDGEYRWAIDSAAPRFGSDGEFLGYIGSVMDITDRKRNEELLRIANERSELAESASNGFIYDWSLHEDAVERSQGMAAVIGYRPDEVPACSQWWIEQIHPDDLARVRAETEFVYASSDGKITTEYRVRRRDGSYITAQDRARIFRDKSGRVMRQVGTIVDITARKQAEEEIARLLAEEQVAREVAEQATRAKDEFLAVVSHELRSPLNAILGYTRILRSGPEDREDFNKVTGVIERNAKAQLQIVEDLLDSARIVTGKLRIEPSLVDLVPALEAALDTVRSAAEAKGVTLVANFRRLPERVLGDSTRLQQVVWNLLANAVKFTPAGGRVELRMDGDADHIRIVVSDTGKGVEPEFLPFVFDRFRQADTSSARRYGGVGLGLSLVKHLVELHGGTITAASKGVGRGATFTITLPRRHMELIPPAPPAVTSREVRTEGAIPRDQALSLEGVSLLVVDDQEEARVILTHALSEYGAQVTTVSSGAEALAILSRPPDGRRPDALILDIAMPDEDGYAVLKKVRALEAEQGVVVYQIPAIALTAHARAEDRLRALQAGFQMHVAKPVEPTELALVILSLIKRFDIKPGS